MSLDLWSHLNISSMLCIFLIHPFIHLALHPASIYWAWQCVSPQAIEMQRWMMSSPQGPQSHLRGETYKPIITIQQIKAKLERNIGYYKSKKRTLCRLLPPPGTHLHDCAFLYLQYQVFSHAYFLHTNDDKLSLLLTCLLLSTTCLPHLDMRTPRTRHSISFHHCLSRSSTATGI